MDLYSIYVYSPSVLSNISELLITQRTSLSIPDCEIHRGLALKDISPRHLSPLRLALLIA